MRGSTPRLTLVLRSSGVVASGCAGALLWRARSRAAQKRGETALTERADRALAQLASELEQSRQSSQETSRLIAGASHELRTPLNAIIGFADLMFDEQLGPMRSEHRECLDDIRGSARMLLQLINEVLELARIEAGLTAFAPRAIDPAKIASESVESLRSHAAARHVTLRLDAEAFGTVWLDPVRLGQVLLTLLDSAIRSSPPHAEVRLALRRTGDELLIEVTDTGPRIAACDQDRAFDEPIRGRDRGGAIGLAVTRRIVEAQRGTVAARSLPGEGNTFSAQLPSSWGAAAAATPASQAAAA